MRASGNGSFATTVVRVGGDDGQYFLHTAFSAEKSSALER
jgi:hypothetical protein